jgi:hypothetical protein
MKSAEPVDRSSDWAKRLAVEKENKAKALDGIISYLTKKNGGNVLVQDGFGGIASRDRKARQCDCGLLKLLFSPLLKLTAAYLRSWQEVSRVEETAFSQRARNTE